MEQAQAAAERALATDDITDQDRLERAFRETLGRCPLPEERTIAVAAVAVPEGEGLNAGRGGSGCRLGTIVSSFVWMR